MKPMIFKIIGFHVIKPLAILRQLPSQSPNPSNFLKPSRWMSATGTTRKLRCIVTADTSDGLCRWKKEQSIKSKGPLNHLKIRSNNHITSLFEIVLSVITPPKRSNTKSKQDPPIQQQNQEFLHRIQDNW